MAEATKAEGSALATPGENLQSEREPSTTEALIAPLVASPTGPVPLSAITNDPKRAEELRAERTETLKRERQHPRAGDYLDEDLVKEMPARDLRVVAGQRGYKMNGGRISAESFLRQQDDDEDLRMPEKEEAPKKKSSAKR